MAADLKDVVAELGLQRPAHEAVADALRRRIALGGLSPGESLPPERVLADVLGIGRATLRRAIRQLNREGLVETTVGRRGGTIVRSAAPISLANRTRLAAELEGLLQRTFDFRAAVEPAAARLAAAHAGDRERADLARLVEHDARDIRSYHALDSRLHVLIGVASGNELFAEAIERARQTFFSWANAFWLNVDWTRLSSVSQDPDAAFRTDHLPIVESIVVGDGRLAERRMRRHLGVAVEQFRELLRLQASGDRGHG